MARILGGDEGWAAALGAVRAGELVVVPTDTVYGIGCDPLNVEAIGNIFEAKGRSTLKAIPSFPAIRTTRLPSTATVSSRDTFPGRPISMQTLDCFFKTTFRNFRRTKCS